jgi:hypothetical protein
MQCKGFLLIKPPNEHDLFLIELENDQSKLQQLLQDLNANLTNLQPLKEKLTHFGEFNLGIT